MSRRWILTVGVLAAVVGTTAVLAAMLFVSWRMALTAQQKQLDRDATSALLHVEAVYADAVGALRQISTSDAEPCSPRNIREMLQMTESSLTVDNIAYGAGDTVECNSSGLLPYRLKKASIAIEQPDHVGLVVNWRPATFGTDRAMFIARLGGYSTLVDQRRFFGDWGGSGASVLADIRARDGSPLRVSFADQDPVRTTTQDATSQKSAGGWTVTVRQLRVPFAAHLMSQRVLLLPLSITLALLCGLIAWLWLRRRLSLRGELAAAVRNRDFIAHYQPIIELATGRCVGVEALARWQRPDGRQVPPDIFIPMAESLGLIGSITDQIVALVLRDLGEWMRSDPHGHVAINLSAADVSSGRILDVLETALRGSGVKPAQIWIEATERGVMDMSAARQTLAELRRRGHSTAIDDFGAGYSGLSYLQRLPVDVLKIDRSFIEVVGTEAPTRSVTQHIIAMAHELDLQIVAEGVETEEQAAYLRAFGVGFAQGWLFSRALPPSEFLAYCTANRRDYGMPSGFVERRQRVGQAA